MPPSRPFIVEESGALDTDQILQEAYPLVGLIALFGALALVPFAIVVLLGGLIGGILTLLAQSVLAVGTGIILIYAIARGIQLADEPDRP